MMRPSITSFSWVWGWFELVSLRSCLLGSSSRSLLLHPIHKSIIRFALLLFGLPAQFLRASPGGILFQRSLRFSNAGKAGFTASELRWDVLFSLFNAQPLVFLLVDRARSLQGAGEFNPPDKARFYRMALRSGTESAASLHTCLRRRLANEQKVQAARAKLKRVVKMLTRLIKSMNARRAA